jgi:hypothetical protein
MAVRTSVALIASLAVTAAGDAPSRGVYSDLREAMSMEKRYFTSDLSSRS